MGDSFSMGQAMPFAKSALQGAAGQDPMVSAQAEAYKAKLAKIAQMDQKLAGVYSDPKSKLYIEHAGQRDRAVGGAIDVENKDLSRINQDKKSAEKAADDKVDTALELYRATASAMTKLEAEVKRNTKKAGKGKKSSDDFLKQMKAAMDKINYGITEDAGIQDPEAANLFTTTPVDFQRKWLRDVLSGADEIPEGGFTLQEVQDNLKAWKDKYQPKETEDDKQKKKIDNLLGQFSSSAPTKSNPIEDKIRQVVGLFQ